MKLLPTTLIAAAFFFRLAYHVKVVAGNMMMEVDRLVEYEKRHHTWPLQQYVPNTPGWKALMEERFRQISEIDNSDARYEGYLQTINSALTAPNFTETGIGLTRAPDDLMADLRAAIREGVETARPEPFVDIIEGTQPLFVDRPDLTARVHQELKPFVEAWSDIELIPSSAYGFRLMTNQSYLNMHVDRAQTHVLSFILHIDHSDDSEPWPIFIEDFQGNTHEVILTSGDMLFYESSKCFHGRPRVFRGSWYSSIFVHYYPKYGWAETDHVMDQHYAVPPAWIDNPTEPKVEDQLEMVGTSMKHPNCKDLWCNTKNTVKWGGPGEHGVWIAGDGTKHVLNVEKFARNGDIKTEL